MPAVRRSERLVPCASPSYAVRSARKGGARWLGGGLGAGRVGRAVLELLIGHDVLPPTQRATHDADRSEAQDHVHGGRDELHADAEAENVARGGRPAEGEDEDGLRGAGARLSRGEG